MFSRFILKVEEKKFKSKKLTKLKFPSILVVFWFIIVIVVILSYGLLQLERSTHREPTYILFLIFRIDVAFNPIKIACLLEA